MQASYQSWGRFPKALHRVQRLWWQEDARRMDRMGVPLLAYGQGRSYGDVCLNDGGTLLDTRGLDRFLCFDPRSGRLRCEAGVTLDEIIRTFVPRGWFPPVLPGTKFVTLGGAIANDIHGKNHHRSGTFGCHVLQFELVRTGGERLVCTPSANPELFSATIGGLGLTGLITWAELKLRPLASCAIRVETIKFANLDEFFEISRQSDPDFEYTVAWVDCQSRGPSLGRGLFMRGNHVFESQPSVRYRQPRSIPIPFEFPELALNHHTIKVFNGLYYHRQRARLGTRLVDFDSFFFPLDRLLHWNRIYGRRGLLQYQCVVPFEPCGLIAMRKLFKSIADAGLFSFLAVLKIFGEARSPGMMSFPRPGVTLTLDFPVSPETMHLLARLDLVVAEAGGAVYPAKDARMAPADFRRFYPQWEQFSAYRDSRFSSSFWRRVTARA
jgi:FAD/FMN-containing dehydrogenase